MAPEHILNAVREIPIIYEKGFVLPLLSLVYEREEQGYEVGIYEIHKILSLITPNYNSYRQFLTRLADNEIIQINASKFKSNKKVVNKGSKFPSDLFD